MGKSNPWAEWINVQRKWTYTRVAQELKKLPEEKRQLYALAISVAKWHPDNDAYKYDLCGLCVLNDMRTDNWDCDNCCLYKYWGTSCLDFSSSPYDSWISNVNKNTQATMFKDIFKLYKKEWNKFYGKGKKKD